MGLVSGTGTVVVVVGGMVVVVVVLVVVVVVVDVVIVVVGGAVELVVAATPPPQAALAMESSQIAAMPVFAFNIDLRGASCRRACYRWFEKTLIRDQRRRCCPLALEGGFDALPRGPGRRNAGGGSHPGSVPAAAPHPRNTTTDHHGNVNTAEYVEHDAVGIAELVQRGEVHPREIVAAAIDRIERVDPELNAVVHRWFDRAIEEAGGELPDGPLRGVPLLLKDLGAEVAGLTLTNGSRALKGYRPAHDSGLVARYRRAGIVLLGRTNTPEFGLALSTEPRAYGPTRNPWDPTRSPGASSGGSAASVAARYVPAAHGSDGGGSIRIPASCCGLFGLLPSRGRNPAGTQGWLGLTREHVLTRSVRDSAAFLDVSAETTRGAALPPPPLGTFRAEAEAQPRTLRIAFTRKPLLGDHPQHHDCLTALEQAARLCSELGHEVEELSPEIDGERLLAAYITIVAASTAVEVRRLAGLVEHSRRRELEPITRFLTAMGARLGAAELAAALMETERARHRMERFHTRYDLLLTATLAEPPFELGAFSLRANERLGLDLVRRLPSRALVRRIVDQKAGRFIGTIPNTMLFNMTGQPAMSVPLHWSEAGLPIGVQFAAAGGNEPMLFRLAGQLEKARPWGQRRPNLDVPAASTNAE